MCCDDYCCPYNTVCGEKKGECKALTNENWTLIKLKAKKRDECSTNKNKGTCSPDSTPCQNSSGAEVCCPYS